MFHSWLFDCSFLPVTELEEQPPSDTCIGLKWGLRGYTRPLFSVGLPQPVYTVLGIEPGALQSQLYSQSLGWLFQDWVSLCSPGYCQTHGNLPSSNILPSCPAPSAEIMGLFNLFVFEAMFSSAAEPDLESTTPLPQPTKGWDSRSHPVLQTHCVTLVNVVFTDLSSH